MNEQKLIKRVIAHSLKKIQYGIQCSCPKAYFMGVLDSLEEEKVITYEERDYLVKLLSHWGITKWEREYKHVLENKKNAEMITVNKIIR